MRWLDSITNSKDMNVSKFLETVKDREAWHAAVHGVTESWTTKNAECQTIDTFKLLLEKTLESPLDCKEIQPVNPKGNQS